MSRIWKFLAAHPALVLAVLTVLAVPGMLHRD
jgi:hypothetical protein